MPAAHPVAEEAAAITSLQSAVLESVARGHPLADTAALLCRQVEALAPELLCSVLLIDEAGLIQPLAAPSLPPFFSTAIRGAPIGPKAGSCGTAAWRREPVQVSDIENDPLWADYLPLARRAGVAACWSSPIFTAADRVGATFALYYRERRPIAPFHRQMVEACVRVCQLALRHEEHRRQIEHLAFHDSLTGLHNRRYFAEQARRVLLQAERQQQPCALMLLDVDRFKPINDSLGHAAGDGVLQAVARRLSDALRRIDLLARFGGDEFVMLLPDTGPEQAQQVAAKLHEALQQPLTLDAVELGLTASIGIAAFPGDGTELDTLLRSADAAMYEAKRSGRRNTRRYRPASAACADEALRIEGALRRALHGGRLHLHYQPRLHLDGRGPAGVEALLRWTDPELGELPPARLIRVAEDSGLIQALDAWVLEQACAQLAAWRRRGLALPGLSVNISAATLDQPELAVHLALLLERHGLRPQDLTLEIPERLLAEHGLADRAARLQPLGELGLRLSVQDFGSGATSLPALRRLPVGELKLGSALVHRLEAEPDARALASAVLGIGRALEIPVVASGVETTGQQDWLRSAGFELAQGLRLGRPLPADALADWLGGRP